MADAGSAGPAHRGHAAAPRGPATPSWKGLGRGETRAPAAHGGTGWFLSLLGAQRGFLGCSKRGRRVRGRREAPVFVAGGVRDVPMAPVQTAAAAARECPGRGDPGLKANRRRAGGWEKGRKPVSLYPLPPRHGGARGERGVQSPGHWRASPGLQEGSTARPPPKPALLGAEKPLTSCQGTARPSGCPSLCQREGERAQGVCAAGAGGL